MIVHQHSVAGEPVQINVVENEDDLEGFRNFIRGNLRFLGLDTETTGLNTYQDDFRCRLVQFGNHREAWVVPVELGGRFQEDVRMALRGVQGFVLHNASYDLQVIEQTLGVPMEELWPKVQDTKILAHLVDPRPLREGGTGHSLEELTRAYLDEEVADSVKSLMRLIAAEYKTTKAFIWQKVDLFDPRYTLYAGMDPILAARLMSKLVTRVPGTATPLIAYELKIAEICSYMERKGFLLDVDYSEKLSAEMLRKRETWAAKANVLYGLENVNAPEQCADALERTGVRILGRTESGKRQVNSTLLDELAAQGNHLAESITEAKKWGKWEKTWVRNFLSTRDSQDRVHPGINPLQARTGRMSITNPPTQTLPAGDWTIRRCFLADEGHLISSVDYQTLPSGDWTIRRCFLADEGHLISSVDYQTQELRVLAALSGDPTMLRAFAEGLNLHILTARAAFGDHITKDDKEYKVGKMANFLTVYGGGPKALMEQGNVSMAVAKKVLAAFARTYPKVDIYSKVLAKQASQQGYITTPVGRRLPVDPSRSYSALNYMVQSSSRDVTCRALIRLHEAGFTPYLRLPIHDEILASLPAEQAQWGAAEIGRIMAEQMGPVLIGTDPEVGGRAWGSLYIKDEELANVSDPYLLKAV